MLKATGFDHVNMNVKNFDETVSFYMHHLGFEVLEESKSAMGNEYKIMGIPGKLYLAIYESVDPVATSDKGYVNHLGIHIQNFDMALDYIKDNNIPYEYGGYVEYGKARSIYIIDPNGYEIELSEVFGSGLGL
ncbi:MAG: VOC family protein [Bacteriovoracaceae bacterium]|jgi:lactoylglutathione lyase|nr:VOC family protein [Bacteriovoracaceae bacterium]